MLLSCEGVCSHMKYEHSDVYCHSKCGVMLVVQVTVPVPF